MKGRSVKNPLGKRIFRELAGDWKKYLLVSLFLIATIGFVSGMYVAGSSMMAALDDGAEAYRQEDGHFELAQAADADFLKAASSGERADVKQYYLDKARRELDARFAAEFKPKFDEEFNVEFKQEFDGQFDTAFKAEFDASFDAEFKREFDPTFNAAFTENFNQGFEAQLLNSLLAQGLDEASAEAMLPAALAEAQATGAYKAAYDAAYSPAYNEAYAQAYDEAYNTAYSQAYAEAWNEVETQVDESYAEAVEKYDLENPDFQAEAVTLYENFFKNAEEDQNGDGVAEGDIRVYKKSEDINLASILEGRLPESAQEIAIDRMHADNVGLKIGDSLRVGDQDYEIVGLISYVNYYTLHESPTDFMFDALKFDVAMVTAEGFDRLSETVHYNYAWQYAQAPSDDGQEKTASDNFLAALVTQTVAADNTLEDYVPAYANPAIYFAPEDMGSDQTMCGVMLDILIVIIAFIFGVTITNTITREAKTVGTLRASGYTRGELTRHYLAAPVIITLFSAVAGNVLGYTLFKSIVVSMYYNSYSLPAYETLWNADAFLKTTLVPVALMLLVNLGIIVRMLRHTPLQFIRRDLKKQRKRGAVRLPGWRFLNRFRLRIVLQNLPNYAILFVGILFVSVLLTLAVGMSDSLKYYKANAADMMFSEYQYILKDHEDDQGKTIETANAQAEAFSVTTLEISGEAFDEEISVYGVQEDSAYVDIPELTALDKGEVYISEPFAEKYRLKLGDSFTLKERYEKGSYQFAVAGIYDHCQSLAVFMSAEGYREVFGQEEGAFDGYFTNSEITDIDAAHIATVITSEDITKMCDQLDHSMGSYMAYFQVLCILLAAVLIYLLTKIIIEKNEKAISMVKILGYENRELAGIYLVSTTVVVILADAVCMLLGEVIISQVWRAMMSEYSGWFGFMMRPTSYAKVFGFILLGYLAVMALDFRRIKRIPLETALKDMD
ncbi:MAG: ABC transporter permease [Eubacterium sp.]|nr:ABC transporter permease [Eubacterium sp.]